MSIRARVRATGSRTRSSRSRRRSRPCRRSDGSSPRPRPRRRGERGVVDAVAVLGLFGHQVTLGAWGTTPERASRAGERYWGRTGARAARTTTCRRENPLQGPPPRTVDYGVGGGSPWVIAGEAGSRRCDLGGSGSTSSSASSRVRAPLADRRRGRPCGRMGSDRGGRRDGGLGRSRSQPPRLRRALAPPRGRPHPAGRR